MKNIHIFVNIYKGEAMKDRKEYKIIFWINYLKIWCELIDNDHVFRKDYFQTFLNLIYFVNCAFKYHGVKFIDVKVIINFKLTN